MLTGFCDLVNEPLSAKKNCDFFQQRWSVKIEAGCECVPLNQQFVLKVELNGEWEECSYSSSDEALAAFAGLAGDYKRSVQRAVLLPVTVIRSAVEVTKADRRHMYN